MNIKPLISFDYAIKYLLKNKGDYDIVEGFISALLKAEGYGPVKITALLDTESNKETAGLKKSVADLIVEDSNGQKYIVEIERASTNNFIHKACFNSCRLIIDSISSGDDYSTINKVFHITLLYFLPSNMKKPLYHGKTIFKEIVNKEHVDLHIASLGGQIYDLNILPEYFLISVPLFDDVIRQEIDEWLYVMKHSDTKEDFKSPYMEKVKERLSILKMNDIDKDGYYRYMKEVLTHRDIVSAAEARGEARGEAKGKVEGKAEKAKTIAKKMLKENMDLQLIAKLTNLTIDEINRLKT